MKVEMTGRDEGCGRCAAPRAEALLSAPPTTALQSETCGSKRRPISVPSRRRDANRCNFDESRCNPTATGLQLPARNCTELHQIAPNCTRLRLRQKIKREKTRPEERYSAPIYWTHLFACKVAEASRLLVVKASHRDAAATFPGSLMPALGRLSGTLNPVESNRRQFHLIQPKNENQKMRIVLHCAEERDPFPAKLSPCGGQPRFPRQPAKNFDLRPGGFSHPFSPFKVAPLSPT